MLVRGKSGTIVSASAMGSAGQLKNEGSTTLSAREFAVGCDFDAVCDGSSPPFDEPDAGDGWFVVGDRRDGGFVVAVRELVKEPADQIDRRGELVAPETEACSYIAGVIDNDFERVGEVDEGVISASVDVDAGGARDGTEDAEFSC